MVLAVANYLGGGDPLGLVDGYGVARLVRWKGEGVEPYCTEDAFAREMGR